MKQFEKEMAKDKFENSIWFVLLLLAGAFAVVWFIFWLIGTIFWG